MCTPYTDKPCVLTGSVQHMSRQYADSGWGCGYRNIQMMVSHLLKRSTELRSTLFGGCGFIPDICKCRYLAYSVCN